MLSRRYGILKKALFASAFFVCIYPAAASNAAAGFIAAVVQAATACRPQGPAQTVRVAQVLDGDTLILTDGRHVRLIGVNTPELGRNGAAPEPQANQARAALQRLTDTGSSLQLYEGIEAQDRYGRTLAHLATADGLLLSEQLIRAGLGYALAVPPNTHLADCLFAAERGARGARKGVWQRMPVRLSEDGVAPEAGFGVWRGRVSSTGRTASGAFLELEKLVFVSLGKGVGGALDLQALEGRQVEVRGWLIDRLVAGRSLDPGYRRWLLKIRDSRHLIAQD